MNFKDDPSDYFYQEKNLNSNRQLSGVYKDLSNTCCFTSIITAGLWRLFGNHTNINDSKKVFFNLLDSGINHFDLGNNYGRPPGSAEELFGKTLDDIKDIRDELIISSKAGYEMFPGPNGSGSSLKHLRSQIEGSLKRINIDYLDIFYTHRFDPLCEVEVVADNLKFLYDLGLYNYAGISSYPKDKLFELIELLFDRKVPIACLQYNISLISLENYSLCKECFDKWKISTIAFSPLGQGLLTDSYFQQNKDNYSRINEKSSTVPEVTSAMKESLNFVRDISKKHNISVELMAMVWLLSQDFISSAAYGPRNIDQIFNMIEIKELTNELNNAFDLNLLLSKTIPEVNQWKPRETRKKYIIMKSN